MIHQPSSRLVFAISSMTLGVVDPSNCYGAKTIDGFHLGHS
jgi:hypothetical protein